MASFFRNTFDNFVNNINSTLASSPRTPAAAATTTTQRHSGNLTRPQRRQPSSRPTNTGSSSSSSQNNSNNNDSVGGDSMPHFLRRNIPRYYNNDFRPDNYTPQRASSQPPAAASNEQQQQQYTINQNSNNPNMNPATNTTATNADKLDITDVRDPNDINQLSAKQLKIILTRNCIDYKGIFEKEVLREKVMQLWIDCNEKKEGRRATAQSRVNIDGSHDDSDDLDENQACKICMEREINCVLLECGHMLTCVPCGRKLAECPICRQNVSRCVRTFKG